MPAAAFKDSWSVQAMPVVDRFQVQQQIQGITLAGWKPAPRLSSAARVVPLRVFGMAALEFRI